jgi:alpha-glucosidase (family GH31 glycosyl hydrolase)
MPVRVPLWSLGWNQCRWGWPSTEYVEQVVANYTKAGIPLDVVWSDIDYMENYRDFTVGQVEYKNQPTFVDTLHKNGMYYVPIIDGGVAMRPGVG